MTTFDFAPLFRSTVGFDRLMNLMETSARWADAENGYPPYNIEKTGHDRYRITLAVAGFDEKELSAEVRENVLFIEGRKREPEAEHTYLYRGIAGRSFKRQFQLADHVQVVSASVQNGLLIVDLVRELPEAMKPRKIQIGGGAPRVAATPAQSVAAEGVAEATA
jgi:molecular chaperone IbpA